MVESVTTNSCTDNCHQNHVFSELTMDKGDIHIYSLILKGNLSCCQCNNRDLASNPEVFKLKFMKLWFQENLSKFWDRNF